MEELDQVLDITRQLDLLLRQKITSSNREEVIEELNQLIEKRGEIMKTITPPFSTEENKMTLEIYELNKGVEKKMEDIFSVLKKEMRQMQQQKKSNAFYTNPYKDLQTSDGTFLDSKK